MDNNKTDHECLYKKILDNSYDEIFVVDVNDIIIYVNEASVKHYGLHPDEMIGKPVSEIANKGLWYPRNIHPYTYITKKGFTVEQKTVLGKTLVTTVVPVFDENGDVDILVQNARDKTQLVDFESELSKIRKLLENNSVQDNTIDNKHSEEQNGIITYNNKIKKILKLAQKAVSAGSTLLILGESGTGKGMLAKAVYKNSNRSDRPFITINCAAIPENLLESELFGYEEGAFSGAVKSGKKGLIELANNGVLFLDEISETSLAIQAKLLHVLQDKTYYSVGGREVKHTNAIIIAASNKDIKEQVRQGYFREDLYYRLNVVEVELPPLRERREDLRPLTYFFINKFNEKYGYKKEICKECLELFDKYEWPGNVRELENFIERLIITSEDRIIERDDLPEFFMDSINELKYNESLGSLEKMVEDYQKKIVLDIYRKQKSIRKTAEALGVSKSKAARLINKYK
ncbi:PAS domain S-box-containing protein [Dethiosulfatibacter aminovorans DSM 17477]|uniref:HTH-type transcriptional regulatory protein TyrR n=1 Tax=Dethiosulfatibacter aminovorans DSM 17477 TaxID=1121476 RepID=A0A1M6M5A1_9FIRM|nr:sigma 54-interacting transcriptional regulator [Dethiosulfatibacter aminovorans]SHJ78473.1 PAS domain S-box-containing protein [Dethiosulfatibacter aminovorans DSM 17477]